MLKNYKLKKILEITFLTFNYCTSKCDSFQLDFEKVTKNVIAFTVKGRFRLDFEKVTKNVIAFTVKEHFQIA